ncbi:hypothetical protein K7472_23720 [Streptomyces sp. PTM05]|uniref:Secreted protein n=1 Tax=Streptantibioticus parmotrematis TaxID=2873249 RepID=A0ABS7QX90_9ACTN|nr:hypothetical protein [Streptantibioticus parmotrematis]MBY8887826.1 hypothetical protein [Streptantibioticus parmotrematis]
MTDSSIARRALFVATGSALALGAAVSAASPALADDFDGGHLSVNQGTECALRDVGDVGRNVVATGALPKVFNNVGNGTGRVDGVKELCHAVQQTPRPTHIAPAHAAAHHGAVPRGGQVQSHQGTGLLGGLPIGRH